MEHYKPNTVLQYLSTLKEQLKDGRYKDYKDLWNDEKNWYTKAYYHLQRKVIKRVMENADKLGEKSPAIHFGNKKILI